MIKKQKISEKDRIIDLLERIGATLIYTRTDLSQTDVAKVLAVDNNRVNGILKGIKKTK